jgi:surface antigen
LIISPVTGIVYKVKPGDTVDGLASTYQSNKELLIAINDIEVGGLPVGQYVVLPDGQPAAVATRGGTRGGVPALSGFAWGGYAAVYGSNGYDYGYCTWWAAKRRADIGRPIPSNLGNASTWKVLAQRAGLGVGSAPAAGAVIWTPPRDYYGHVGFVESVNSDGSVNISEMNTAGWARVSYKTLSAAEAARYSYIY